MTSFKKKAGLADRQNGLGDRHHKNLWCRKCVRREIFWNVKVRWRGLCPFNPYFLCNTVTVRPLSGHLTPKMKITFFIASYVNAEYLFIQQVFQKKSRIFWENREKLFWKRIWQFFRGRRRLAPKIYITFFITNKVRNILLFRSFFKKGCIFWENGKNPFLGLKFFERKRGVWGRNWM